MPLERYDVVIFTNGDEVAGGIGIDYGTTFVVTAEYDCFEWLFHKKPPFMGFGLISYRIQRVWQNVQKWD